MQNNEIIECARCILNSGITTSITFDEHGICNYCHYYDSVTHNLGSEVQKSRWLNGKIEHIKLIGKNKEYDCILGVSGGVDSSYLAYWAKHAGLRPLIVHFDNGWNSELAVQNIHKICDRLGFSLQTYVINWEEFRQLQLAYLRAGVTDIEALTDHAIYSTISQLAKKYNIRYTINGFNYATEAIMPKGWVFDKTDFVNIKDINDKFGTTKIKTFPHITFYQRFWYSMFLKIESIRVLNYMDYNKEQAKQLLIEKLGWQDYGGKHYESVFTKFYQAYILPVKFGIDKRYAHLSNLICSGQITKEQAFLELKKPLYDPVTLQEERRYVLKKWGISEEEFDRIMKSPPHKHTDFKTQQGLWDRYFRIIKILRPWKK
jgi:N-acetyl sugar amidotransferase